MNIIIYLINNIIKKKIKKNVSNQKNKIKKYKLIIIKKIK
jgi:hypothetical protein